VVNWLKTEIFRLWEILNLNTTHLKASSRVYFYMLYILYTYIIYYIFLFYVFNYTDQLSSSMHAENVFTRLLLQWCKVYGAECFDHVD